MIEGEARDKVGVWKCFANSILKWDNLLHLPTSNMYFLLMLKHVFVHMVYTICSNFRRLLVLGPFVLRSNHQKRGNGGNRHYIMPSRMACIVESYIV